MFSLVHPLDPCHGNSSKGKPTKKSAPPGGAGARMVGAPCVLLTRLILTVPLRPLRESKPGRIPVLSPRDQPWKCIDMSLALVTSVMWMFLSKRNKPKEEEKEVVTVST